MTNSTRFDYVRIIFRIDHDAFQAHVLPEVRRVAVECKQHVEDATTYKMAPLGVDASNVARYALDCWGEMADYFVLLMPMGWWDLVYRLDLRHTNDAITESALAGLSTHFTTKAPGAVGINTFNTPGAKKTDRRDIGGRGIRFGSRKSDKHAVAYKRRSEPGAFEYRVQGKHAKWLAQTALVNTTATGLGAVYETAFGMMEAEADSFIKSATGRSNFVSLLEWGDYLGRHYQAKQTAHEAAEEQEADAWMQGLPEREQMDLQSATWTPTAKGLQEG